MYLKFTKNFANRILACILPSLICISGAMLLTGCKSNPGAAFATPDEAVEKLVAATRIDDRAELTRILGPGAEDAIYTGDPSDDQRYLQSFLKSYDEKHQLSDGSNGEKILEIGPTNYPIAFPLVKTDKGWQFDLAAGEDELLSRRIGRNELDTIQTCLAVCDAQQEYWTRQPQGTAEYAAKFISDANSKNGLFWKVGPGEQPSPLGELAARATAEGYKRNDPGSGPQPYHGYCYRILTAQGPDAPGGKRSYMVDGKLIGGFAVVAYPFDYGNTGIKTFIINQQGVIFQNDLGENTESIALDMTEYNPDSGWDIPDASDRNDVPDSR